METKLNSYILTNEVKREMRNELDKTQQEELGFTLCEKDNNLVARGQREGEKYKIKLSSRCKPPENFVGDYHTHLYSSDSSAGDLIACGHHKIICIGGRVDNKIKCQIWKRKQISEKEMLNVIGDIKSRKEQPTNSEHKTNFDCIKTMARLSAIEDLLKQEKLPKYMINEIEKEFNEKIDNVVDRLAEQIAEGKRIYYREIEIK